MQTLEQDKSVALNDWLTEKHLQLLLLQQEKKQGPIVELPSEKKKVVALNGIEAINEAIVDQADLLGRPVFKAFQNQNKIIQNIVETQNGERFKCHRGEMEKVLRDQVNSRASQVEDWLIEEVNGLVDTFSKNDGPIDPGSAIAFTTLSFIQRLAFGRPLSPEEAEFFDPKAVDVLPLGVFDMVKLDDLSRDDQREGFLSIKSELLEIFGKAVDGLEGFVAHNIQEQKTSFNVAELRGVCDALINAHQQLQASATKTVELSEYELFNGSLFQFVGAGVGLTTFAMRFALHYMIVHPEIQAQIQEELDSGLASGTKPSFSNRKAFPLTEATVWEILRHTSMTTFAPLHYEAKEDIKVNGTLIEKGTMIIANYHSLTRDERYWENPEEFRPSRFLDSDNKIHRDLLNKFYPFGIGPRRCVGEHLGRTQIFTFFASLLSQCEFKKTPNSPEILGKHSGVFLIPHNYELTVSRRTS